MRLRVLASKRFEVVEIADSDDSATSFLRDSEVQWSGMVKGMKALWARYAEMGRQGMTADWFHEASRSEDIWQFRKGRLRVFCFVDGGRLLILTHGAIKKTQKASIEEVNRAIAARDRYLVAKQRGLITRDEE